MEKFANSAPASGAQDVLSPVAAPEQFLRKKDVARLLNVSLRTVDYWMAKGSLPFYKQSRAVKFLWSEIVGHMKANNRVCLRRFETLLKR